MASEPFVDQMRRGSVHVNASRKTFNNIYARFLTFHRMGASQERADFLNALLLVVTRHPGGPTGRPKIHPVLARFALLFFYSGWRAKILRAPQAASVGNVAAHTGSAP